MAYPDALNKPSTNSYNISELHESWTSDSPVELHVSRILRMKYSKSSLYQHQVYVEFRQENMMQLETRWMDQEKCEDMDGYDDAFEAYTKNKRAMCRK